MKRVLALAAVSGLLISTLFLGTSSAHVRRIDTTLTIGRSPAGSVDQGTRVLVFGKIKPHKCRLGQHVRVFEAGPGADDVIGSDNLDADGEYSVRVRADSDMSVYAKVSAGVIVSNYQHTHKCKSDRSPTISINVS